MLLGVALYAKESHTVLERLTLTNISFNVDENGNLNPYIFIPLYYGAENQYYSSIAYSSRTRQEVSGVSGFTSSKNAFISRSKELTLNYITYKKRMFGLTFSFGLESSMQKVINNEFGYIEDRNNLFGKGSNYYISFDNEVKLDILSHAVRADVVIPTGDYFVSRLFVALSPWSRIGVNQETLFKPLVDDIGRSSSKTLQNITYRFRYDGLLKTGYTFDVGCLFTYENQALRYGLSELTQVSNQYRFRDAEVDTNELKTEYLLKILFHKEVLGGLRPSFGYGVENIERVDNLTAKKSRQSRKIFLFAFEKLF